MKNKKLMDTLRDSSTSELEKKRDSLKEEAFNIRFQLATSHGGDYARIRKNKRTIARINTIIRERELAE